MERVNGENMTGKIFALLLAIILWVYVMNEQNPPVEQTANVKLEVRNVAQGLFLVEGTETIKIRYRGPRSIIAGLRPLDLVAYVDAHGLQEGEHSLAVKAVIPGALELIEVSPNTAIVRLESQITRNLPVTPKFTGATPAGVVINKAGIIPVQATITGPRSKVEQVSAVMAIAEMSGVDKDVILEGTPRAYGKNGSVITDVSVSPEKVQLQISILKGVVTKLVDIKPVITGEPVPGVTISRITTEPNKLEISGQAEKLKTIDWVYTLPIDIAGQSSDLVREVKLQLQEGIVAAKGDTVKVSIRVNPPR
jgi:YbbR domain-containing protein